MYRYILLLVILLHALIHLIGFFKKNQLNKRIRIAWLLAALVFVMSVLVHQWWWWALSGIILSQWLIIRQWKEARWGTVVNLFILLMAWVSYGFHRFENQYKNDITSLHFDSYQSQSGLVTDSSIRFLPLPVQRYIQYSGAIGKPVPALLFIRFEGRMRGRKQDWFSFRSEQYNRLDIPARYFFMKGRLYNMMVPGYHAYHNGKANMQIRLFGWIPLVQVNGPELDKGETVTWLNDVCLFAPGALVYPHFKWESIDSLHARVRLETAFDTVSAMLEFNISHQLVNFYSTDRYEVNDKKFYLFSTPAHNYQLINGYRLNTSGEGIWHYPDGPFVYGEFNLKEINLK